MSVDTFKGWTGHPFTLYVDDIQEWYIALCYVLKLIIFWGVGPPLLCQLILSRGGHSFTPYVDDIQEWYCPLLCTQVDDF